MWAAEGKGKKMGFVRSALGVSSTSLKLLGGQRGGEGLGPCCRSPGGAVSSWSHGGMPTSLCLHQGAHHLVCGASGSVLCVLEGGTPWVHRLR